MLTTTLGSQLTLGDSNCSGFTTPADVCPYSATFFLRYFMAPRGLGGACLPLALWLGSAAESDCWARNEGMKGTESRLRNCASEGRTEDEASICN